MFKSLCLYLFVFFLPILQKSVTNPLGARLMCIGTILSAERSFFSTGVFLSNQAWFTIVHRSHSPPSALVATVESFLIAKNSVPQ